MQDTDPHAEGQVQSFDMSGSVFGSQAFESMSCASDAFDPHWRERRHEGCSVIVHKAFPHDLAKLIAASWPTFTLVHAAQTARTKRECAYFWTMLLEARTRLLQ